MSEEVDGVMLRSVSETSAGATLTAVTDLVSVNMHSLFLAMQHEQGCCRSHLHLARAQGAHDFRLDLGDLSLLFRVSRKRSLLEKLVITHGLPHIRKCFVRRSLLVNWKWHLWCRLVLVRESGDEQVGPPHTRASWSRYLARHH